MKQKQSHHKKRNIRGMIASLLICLLLFSACGNKEQAADNKETGKQETENKTPDKGTENETDTNTVTEDSKYTFPLAEKQELSMWLVWSNSYVEDPNDLLAIQKIEENTNVHVNWTVVSMNEQSEKFGLMLASDDYPEIIYNASLYPNGMAKGVEDGVYLDLTEWVSDYMPHYDAIRRSDEKVYKDSVTDEGKIIAIYVLACDDDGIRAEPTFAGFLVRQDWLDEMEMPLPVTMEDWHVMLKGFKDNYHCEGPHLMFKDGMDFITAYGIQEEFYQENGVIKYGPLEEGYRQYLEEMNQWYKEGLLDPNFLSSSLFWPSAEETATNRGGSSRGIWGESADNFVQRGTAKDPNFWLSAVVSPVQKEGESSQLRTALDSQIVKTPLALTKNCKNPELALSWLDYWYTEECMMLSSYGIEGETYTLDADGKVKMTDLIMNNPDGYSPGDALGFYTLAIADFGLYNWKKMDVAADASMLDARVTWDTMSRDLVIPASVTMTAEEAYRYADTYTAIKTLVQEMSLKYIIGQESFDGYDKFQKKILEYGIEDCIALWQAALDRYNNR